MEASEVHEFSEQLKEGAEKSLMHVSLIIAILAVLVAMVTVLSHRAHTKAVLEQTRAADQWNEYQAHKIRSNNTALISDLLSVVTIADKDAEAKIQKSYADHQTKWNEDLKELMDEASALEAEVNHAEKRADRFDLSEAMLEIGLVITSVTLLTRNRRYWFLGMAFSVFGIASALSVLLLK